MKTPAIKIDDKWYDATIATKRETEEDFAIAIVRCYASAEDLKTGKSEWSALVPALRVAAAICIEAFEARRNAIANKA